jgi:hypothetical protein
MSTAYFTDYKKPEGEVQRRIFRRFARMSLRNFEEYCVPNRRDPELDQFLEFISDGVGSSKDYRFRREKGAA